MAKTVTISAAEYADLKDAAFKLQCLENGGVDNWEWYGESLRNGGYADDDDDDEEDESP